MASPSQSQTTKRDEQSSRATTANAAADNSTHFWSAPRIFYI
jgi:hypothetical protein